MTDTAPYWRFLRDTVTRASAAGVGLELEETADGYRWQWSDGVAGVTTARTCPVAFYHACEDWAMSQQVKANFKAFNPNAANQ